MKLVELAAALVPNGATLPIVRGPLRGCWWTAGAAAGQGKGLSVLVHSAERAQLEAAQSLLTPQSVCFDIGANVGLYTLLFGRYGRRVYAFEPLPRNLHYLHQIVRSNHLLNVTIVPCAVGDRVELTRFQLGANCALGRIGAAGDQPAVCVPLDEFAERYGVEPDVIKIDVEGGEQSVLHGGRRLLRRKHPDILLSLHSVELRHSCLAALREAGYRRFQPLDTDDLETAIELAARRAE